MLAPRWPSSIGMWFVVIVTTAAGLTGGQSGADELADMVARKCWQRVDALRGLVACQDRTCVCDQFFLVERRARPQHHPRGHLLAPVIVRHPRDGRLGHRRVAL